MELYPHKDFTSLTAWSKARTVKQFFYKKVLPKLPLEERFSIGEQIRRASVSCTANIAEGYGRYHYREGIQFYRIARGSLFELKDHLLSCMDFGYIPTELADEGLAYLNEAKSTLNGYIKYVKSLDDKK
jgi:four helix bundle protein